MIPLLLLSLLFQQPVVPCESPPQQVVLDLIRSNSSADIAYPCGTIARPSGHWGMLDGAPAPPRGPTAESSPSSSSHHR
jgi:hypothetical protein